MGTFRKVLKLAMIALLVSSVIVTPVFASASQTPTVDPQTEGTLTVNKFRTEDLPGPGFSPDWSAGKNIADKTAEPVKGVKYHVTRTHVFTYSGAAPAFITGVQATVDPVDYGMSAVTTSDGVLTISGLPQGRYKFVEYSLDEYPAGKAPTGIMPDSKEYEFEVPMTRITTATDDSQEHAYEFAVSAYPKSLTSKGDLTVKLTAEDISGLVDLEGALSGARFQLYEATYANKLYTSTGFKVGDPVSGAAVMNWAGLDRGKHYVLKELTTGNSKLLLMTHASHNLPATGWLNASGDWEHDKTVGFTMPAVNSAHPTANVVLNISNRSFVHSVAGVDADTADTAAGVYANTPFQTKTYIPIPNNLTMADFTVRWTIPEDLILDGDPVVLEDDGTVCPEGSGFKLDISDGEIVFTAEKIGTNAGKTVIVTLPWLIEADMTTDSAQALDLAVKNMPATLTHGEISMTDHAYLKAGSAVVTAQAIDDDGNPLAGITYQLEVKGPEGVISTLEATSDDQGIVTWYNIPDGEHIIRQLTSSSSVEIGGRTITLIPVMKDQVVEITNGIADPEAVLFEQRASSWLLPQTGSQEALILQIAGGTVTAVGVACLILFVRSRRQEEDGQA